MAEDLAGVGGERHGGEPTIHEALPVADRDDLLALQGHEEQPHDLSARVAGARRLQAVEIAAKLLVDGSHPTPAGS